MYGWLKKIADNRESGSVATGFRLKRMEFFKKLVAPLPKPVKILDVGGTDIFWERMGLAGDGRYQIVFLNTDSMPPVRYDNLTGMSGDARDLSQFKDRSFDVVFSNSVIEHVGGPEDRIKMASEVRRVGSRYFVRTPNKWFPIEPHFLFPFFQFLPLRAKVFLLRRFHLGWYQKQPDRQKAEELARSIELLTRRDLAALFPGGAVREEKCFGLVKSFTIYHGFEAR